MCGWRHARLENGMPSGAGFDSYAFREYVSSNSRTAGIWLRALTSLDDFEPTRDGYRDQRMPVQLRPRVHIWV